MLGIDIGNSSVKIGFFKEKISSLEVKVFQDIKEIPELKVNYIVYSSVSPSKEKLIFAKIKANKVEEILPQNIKDLNFEYSPLRSLGKDRVAAALGGYKIYGGNSLIVDFGTALTLDFINKNGVFKGGMIVPGPQAILDCLKTKTEKVKVDSFSPLSRLGKSTMEAVNSGITNSIVGIINRAVEISRAEKIIFTGGYFHVFKDFLNNFEFIYDKWLVLKGLYLYGKARKR